MQDRDKNMKETHHFYVDPKSQRKAVIIVMLRAMWMLPLYLEYIQNQRMSGNG
jgi:hypothetical protein